MKYFKLEEFMCSCGCGENLMDDEFLAAIDLARTFAGIPFRINSGYRCDKHNKEVGSTSKNHTSGKAADIQCEAGANRYLMVKALIDAGFRRIGIGKNFIHADTMNAQSSIWLY